MLVGLTAGRAAALDLGAFLRKRVHIVGTVLRSRPLQEKFAAATHLEELRAARPVASRPLQEKFAAATMLSKNLGPLFQTDRLRPLPTTWTVAPRSTWAWTTRPLTTRTTRAPT